MRPRRPLRSLPFAFLALLLLPAACAEPAPARGPSASPGAPSALPDHSEPARLPAAHPDGARCLSGAECVSGTCEGQGCDPEHPGVCAAKDQKCTLDRVRFCGCDGKAFGGSSTCPGGRYDKEGFVKGGRCAGANPP